MLHITFLDMQPARQASRIVGLDMVGLGYQSDPAWQLHV